jgi:hypothetical protein
MADGDESIGTDPCGAITRDSVTKDGRRRYLRKIQENLGTLRLPRNVVALKSRVESTGGNRYNKLNDGLDEDIKTQCSIRKIAQTGRLDEH